MSTETQGIFITERPTMYPAACSRCSSQRYDGRKYVDFGVDQELISEPVPGVTDPERKGVVYLCSLCVREIYRAVFPNEGLPVAQIESDLADAQQKVELLQAINKNLEKELEFHKKATLNDPRHNTSDSSSSADSSDPVSSDETKPVRKTADKSKSGTTKSTPKSRPKNVPSLTELLETKR